MWIRATEFEAEFEAEAEAEIGVGTEPGGEFVGVASEPVGVADGGGPGEWPASGSGASWIVWRGFERVGGWLERGRPAVVGERD